MVTNLLYAIYIPEAILGYKFTEVSTMYSEDHMEDYRQYFRKDQV